MPGRTKNSLIVFAKPPVGGTVKTRLIPAIGTRDATDLYRCFLLDSIDQYCRIGFPVRLYFRDGEIPLELESRAREAHLGHARVVRHEVAPPGDDVAFARRDAGVDDRDVVAENREPKATNREPKAANRSAGIEILRQRGEVLGERMANAFLETFAMGFNNAVIIGTDHPSLPDEYIRLALDLLGEPKTVVLGPSEDGGYYLLGMNHFYPQLFRDMEYGHSDVLDQTIDRATETDASLTLLPMWYDVDTPEMLDRLLRDLRSDPASAPRTAEMLEVLSMRHSFLF